MPHMGGAYARLRAMQQAEEEEELGHPEAADILGEGEDDLAALGLGEDAPMPLGAGYGGPDQMMGTPGAEPPAHGAEMGEGLKDMYRNLMVERAKKRASASEKFQERAYQMNKRAIDRR